jgi:hypothetical protein
MSSAGIFPELSQPVPRPVRSRRGALIFPAVAAILVAVATAVILYPPPIRTASIVDAAMVDLAILAVVWLLPLLSKRQQVRLLATGCAAPAVIVERLKYSTPRHVRAKIIYEFTDAAGRRFRGVRIGLPVAILADGAIDRPDIAAMLAHPTVVYDRDNPGINMLYPFDQVEIVDRL